MSGKLFDTRILAKMSPTREKDQLSSSSAIGSVKRRSLSPPRRNPECSTHHQYAAEPNDYFTVIVYDKDHNYSPYVNMLLVNVPRKEIHKGQTIFPLEKIPLDSTHHYNVDIYRQGNGEIKVDVIYPDEKRKKFSINSIIAGVKGDLVSREEFMNTHHETATVYLT